MIREIKLTGIPPIDTILVCGKNRIKYKSFRGVFGIEIMANSLLIHKYTSRYDKIVKKVILLRDILQCNDVLHFVNPKFLMNLIRHTLYYLYFKVCDKKLYLVQEGPIEIFDPQLIFTISKSVAKMSFIIDYGAEPIEFFIVSPVRFSFATVYPSHFEFSGDRIIFFKGKTLRLRTLFLKYIYKLYEQKKLNIEVRISNI